MLSICVGNVCRSPLAERLLSVRTTGTGGRVVFESAGIRGLSGHEMERSAARELRRLGGNESGFVARRVSAEMLAGADLILAMTREVRAEVLKEYPRAMRRTFTLREFAHLCRFAVEVDAAIFSVAELVSFAALNRSQAAAIDQDVPDPIGRSDEVHRQAADLIAANVDVISALLSPLLRD